MAIKVNGKTYTDLSKGIDAAFAEGIKDEIKKKLSKCHSELNRQNARIEVDIQNGKLTISKIDDDLKVKIEEALK